MNIAELQAHEKRVLEEKQQLDERIAKLEQFTHGTGADVFRDLHVDERLDLKLQLRVMQTYSGILARRIARWGG